MAIDGLVSGLDTTSIIQQLMKIERFPQDLLALRQNKVKAASEAQASIRSKLQDVSSASAALSSATKWNLRTATSTDPKVATVSATNTAAVGSLTFTVDQTAARHSIRSGNVIAGTDTVIASGGAVEVDLGDGVHTIDVGGGTLAEVVSGINSANLRVRAAMVDTGAGYRLQLTSKSSGAASSFDLAGLDASVGGTIATEVGRDASLTIGSGPGAYSVSSASNTFANILPGVSITAVATSTNPVTIDVNEDVDALSDKVEALVEATNAALLEIKARTAYDPTTKTGASLAGDATARRIATELTRALTDAVGGGMESVSQVGVSLERTGRFSFDPTKFKAAYADDPAKVRDMFAQSSSIALDPSVTTGGITFTTAGNRAAAGTYEVVVTQAAQTAAAMGPAASWPTGAPSTIGVRVGSTEVSVDLDGTESAADAAVALQAAITDAGLSLTVSTDGAALMIESVGYGSNSKFDVAWDGATWSSHQGVDIAGTIGGEAATGLGQQLTVSAATAVVGGISVNVTALGTGTLGTVTYSTGAAQRVGSALTRALDTIDGYLTSAEKSNETRVKDLQRSIDDYEIRLEKREARLKQYYSNLEVALSNLQQQSSWLAGQVAGLQASSGS
jgi:flagellar hook-associated protein 2